MLGSFSVPGSVCLSQCPVLYRCPGQSVRVSRDPGLSVSVHTHGPLLLIDMHTLGSQAELGIMDVQLSMSTLEDVFLKVATASELEEAKMRQQTVSSPASALRLPLYRQCSRWRCSPCVSPAPSTLSALCHALYQPLPCALYQPFALRLRNRRSVTVS